MENNFARVITGLNYDFSRFDITHFLTHLQRLRDKEIILKGLQLAPDLHGLWIPCPGLDYLFYNARAHAVHRVHTLLHEAAHMLLDHKAVPLDTLFPQGLPPHIEPDEGLLKQMGLLRRIDLERRLNGQEREAEAFVSELQYYIVRAGRGSHLSTTSTSIPSLAPFTGSLSFED